ncbi:MAG: DEAD/DEAH box helicase [Pirellula sp.]|nr:DEAD/DEAH box helicase [Pirellula sp.]
MSLDRVDIASEFLETLSFTPYPVQEEAIYAWFSSEQGVLVCAPTGTGKTLIAEAAIFEALKTGKRCYYTTPLIALTDQKLVEIQQSALRWGFPIDSIGLVTGNRRVNPDAPVLVVVAEILLNRLMGNDAEHFENVSAVVMDEFHSFNDPERGIVWELTLGLLPKAVRTMLLSATVGNSVEFCSWLHRSHGRNLELVQGTERKVPLQFEWIDDNYLDEHLEKIAEGDDAKRRTPGLVFCFNREQCWQVAELLKGKKLIDKERQAIITKRIDAFDFSQGAGPKLKQILIRGVGVHHAGIMPKYRRLVEQLFQEKLLSVTVCTETLSAGINLPARSVILPSLVKGPFGKKKMVEPSTAHQIFGRAGRPQFDAKGFVYVLAHEDDVKINRWRVQYDQIPEDTKDPNLIKAKKALKKKMPTRRSGETYWTFEQFEKLRLAPAAKLESRGHLPWRLLAYLLLNDPSVQPLRDLVGRRLQESKSIEKGQKELNRMLVTLWKSGFITLEPTPAMKHTEAPKPLIAETKPGWLQIPTNPLSKSANDTPGDDEDDEETTEAVMAIPEASQDSIAYDLDEYKPISAVPTERLAYLSELRSVNPIYGLYMVNMMQFADDMERVQILESVLELPANIAKIVKVPPPDQLPAGPLATGILHPQLLSLGLAAPEELMEQQDDVDDRSDEEIVKDAGGAAGKRRPFKPFEEAPLRPLALGEKLRRLFDYEYPGVHDVFTRSVWVVGELLEFGCEFNKYVVASGMQKHEGLLFRHILRFILLIEEIAKIAPSESSEETWEQPLYALADRLVECCRSVDPECTDQILQSEGREERGRSLGKIPT